MHHLDIFTSRRILWRGFGPNRVMELRGHFELCQRNAEAVRANVLEPEPAVKRLPFPLKPAAEFTVRDNLMKRAPAVTEPYVRLDFY